MRDSYRRKIKEDAANRLNDVTPRRYTRRRAVESTTGLKKEDDGYHFHVDLNLTKDFIDRVSNSFGRIVKGLINFIDTPEDDRMEDRRDRRRFDSRDGRYPERPRRR